MEAESYAELNNGKGYNNLYHLVFEIEDGTVKGIKESKRSINRNLPLSWS